MKKQMLTILLIVVGMLISVRTTVGSYESKQERCEGFRGLKWGMNIKDIDDPNMILVKTSEDKLYTLYTRETDKLSIGESELKTIYYLFYKDELFSVRIFAKGFTNFVVLKNAVFAYYGSGIQKVWYVLQWKWYASFNENVEMDLKYNVFSGRTTFRMHYYPLLKKIEQDAF